MSGSPNPEITEISIEQSKLPFSAIVRALCRAAIAGPDLLYEAMLKLSLMVEACSPAYGLSIWALRLGEPPRIRWAEGLNEKEIDAAKEAVATTLAAQSHNNEINSGDVAICLVLARPSVHQDGAAIYARCVRPLMDQQARELRALVEVAQLAHAYASTKADRMMPDVVKSRSEAACSTLPGMVFTSRAMAEVARAIERVKDSESTVLITGE